MLHKFVTLICIQARVFVKAETLSGSEEMLTAGSTSVDRWATDDSIFPAGRDLAAGCDIEGNVMRGLWSTKYGTAG